MKQNQTQGDEEKELLLAHVQLVKAQIFLGRPPAGTPSGATSPTHQALKEGNTLQSITFPTACSTLKNWMDAFIWASREGRNQSR